MLIDWQPSLSLILAFAAGSIPFGWLIAKLWGVADLRQKGSTNIGATNVVRTAGWVPGALTFVLDFAKGLLPTLYIAPLTDAPGLAAAIATAAVLGHCYSPFLRFRGGKGVSTTFGGLLALNPWLGASCILVYVVALGVSRISAIGSLYAMLAAALGAILFTPGVSDRLLILVMVFIVVIRHHENWDKLLKDGGTLALMLLASALAATTAQAKPRTSEPLPDFRGKPVVAERAPSRVVALIPSLAEMVVELGAAAKLVGVPEYAELPEGFRATAKSLGPYNLISAESVYQLRPDLVLASMDGNEPVLVEKLERLGARVVTINTQSLADIVRTARIVAAALGTPDHPRVRALESRLLAPKPAQASPGPKARKRVFVEIGWDPLITVGPGTFVHELIERAGGTNLFSDAPTRYPRPNAEEVVARDPDVLVICQLTQSGTEAQKSKEFWSRFKKLRAVRDGKVLVLPGDWFAKPGFTLVKGVDELEKILR